MEVDKTVTGTIIRHNGSLAGVHGPVKIRNCSKNYIFFMKKKKKSTLSLI